MFTGLIEDIGTIRRIERAGEDLRVEVSCNLDTAELTLGESIAVDGACFTVVAFEKGAFTFEVSRESLSRTAMSDLGGGDKVHLERAMVLGGRLGGHLVLGHVDGVGTVSGLWRDGNAWRLSIDAPPEVARFAVPKGSITIRGVSLTINSVDGARFDVAIVPFTGKKTLLLESRPGDRVNLEADIIGKYVLKLVGGDSSQPGGGLTADLLSRYGY